MAIRAIIIAAIMASWIALPSMSEEKPMKAKMVYYSGEVQGVGFRMTTAMIARDHPVTGWVKNLSDGRVQLLVEGSAEAIDKFLKAVRVRWKDNIAKEQSEDTEPSGRFKRFDIAK
jgi:acylphosphatase